jgi:hypothetical protein
MREEQNEKEKDQSTRKKREKKCDLVKRKKFYC